MQQFYEYGHEGQFNEQLIPSRRLQIPSFAISRLHLYIIKKWVKKNHKNVEKTT